MERLEALLMTEVVGVEVLLEDLVDALSLRVPRAIECRRLGNQEQGRSQACWVARKWTQSSTCRSPVVVELPDRTSYYGSSDSDFSP